MDYKLEPQDVFPVERVVKWIKNFRGVSQDADLE